MSRVLLIEPPSGLGTVMSAGAVMPLGLVAVAEALRAAGFDAEIYDAMASLGLESIRLHIEHSYPHVVAAASYAATAENAREVLRAAKEVVPGVFTVLLGAQSALVAGKAPRGASVDCFVGDDCAETLPRLLNRLRAGEQLGQISESRAA